MNRKGPYLSVSEIEATGPQMFTIKTAAWDPNVPDPHTNKPTRAPVLVFEEKRPDGEHIRVVLNSGGKAGKREFPSRRRQVEDAYGRDWRKDWPGKKIVVEIGEAKSVGGGPMLALRPPKGEQK